MRSVKGGAGGDFCVEDFEAFRPLSFNVTVDLGVVVQNQSNSLFIRTTCQNTQIGKGTIDGHKIYLSGYPELKLCTVKLIMLPR